MSKDEIKALEEKLARLGGKGKEGKEKVEVLNDLAFALYRSNPEKTKEYATQALALGEKLNYRKGVAKSYQIIGISCWMRGDYEEALEHYLKSLKLFEEEGDAKGIAASYRNIGNVYRDRGNNDQALEYYLKSLKICEEIGYSRGIAGSYNNMGIVYCERGNYDKALEYYQRALKIREGIGNKQWLAASYNNIGIVYYEQGDCNKALEYQREALKLREEIGDKHGIILSCNDVGLVYIRLKRYKPASNYLKKGVELARETGARSLEMTTYQHLSELYEAQEDIRQAFDYYRKSSELKAGIFSEESSGKIAQLQVRYEAEKKEREAEIYRIKNVDLEAEIAERKRVEETLRESEEKYRTLQANMPIGVYRTTAKGEVIFVNQAILKMRGYSTEEELMAVPVEDSYVNPKKRKEFTRLLDAEGSVSGFDVQLRRKDDSTFWVSISSRAIKNKKGKVLYYDGIMEDITERKQAEEELRIKDSAIEGAINGIALMDLRGNLTYVNNSCLRMWGYDDPGQAIGKSTAKFYQDKRKVLSVMKALRDEGNWTGEMVAVRKDGFVFPVHLSVNMVKDEAGKPLCAMASFEDISERKKAEEELREREELYRTLVNTAQEGITIVDLDENMVFVNPRMAEFFGYKPDKLIGRSFLDFVPAEEAELIRSQTGQRKKGETSRYELTLIHKNGTHQRVLIAAAPLYDAEGKPYAAIGVFTDITERKRAEEELKRRSDKLRESEELYRTLVDTAQEAIILDDPDENIVFINPTAARLLGYPPEELIGRSLFDFIPPEEVKALRSQTAYRISKQESSRYELTLVHRSGSSRRMLVTGAPVYDAEGKIKATMGVFTDITELSVLGEIGRAISSTLDINEIYGVIHEQVKRLINADNFYIAHYSKEADEVTFPYVFEEGRLKPWTSRRGGKGMTEHVIATGKPRLLHGDSKEEAAKIGVEPVGKPSHSWLGVPMIIRNEVIGVMAVQSFDSTLTYSEKDMGFMETVAQQAAQAVENARAYFNLEQRLTELSAFNEVGYALGSTLDLDELLEVIYAQTSRVMDTESFYIALYDENAGTIEFPLYMKDGKPVDSHTRPFGNGLTEYVIKKRKSLLLKENVANATLKLGIDRVVTGAEAKCWLGVPMISQDRVIGVMTVQSTRKAGLYDEDHERLLSSMANQAAGAVVNARAYEVLEQRVAERTVELEEKLALIQQQRAAILELSTPTIKVWDGVLVIPLIGALDTRRSQRLTEELLTSIGDTQSQIAIIDITGVPTVDSAVANHLLKTASSVRLMGAECVITGIRPEVAQTIIHLGIDLSNIETLSTLAEGLKWAFKQLGRL